MLKQQVIEAKSELKEIEFNMESMNVNIREPAAVGRGKSICGNCHHRGHRNQATKPCVLNKCTDYSYCGTKEKHPEFFSKLNSLKLERRKKENAILDLEKQIKCMQEFSTSSEFQFVKNLTPRMYNIDPTYKTNKCKLMRDVRLLRESLDGRIPPVTANDAEQLSLLITKLRKTKNIADDDNSKQFVTWADMPMDSDCLDHSPLHETRNNNSASTSSTLSVADPCCCSKSSDSESMYSISSTSSSGKDEANLAPLRRKRRKRQKEKQQKKKGKSKAKGRSKRTLEHEYTFNQHANPYFTRFMDPYSVGAHPSTTIRTPFPFQSGYGMYGTETMCQPFAQVAQPYSFVLHGPANVNASTSVPMGSVYNPYTLNNTSPAKQEFPTTNVAQSPSSETVAKTLLELGSNLRLNSNYDC